MAADGKVNLTVRYGSKAIEFEKGKNAIELDSEEQVAATLLKVKDAVKAGEFDELIAAQVGVRIPVKLGHRFRSKVDHPFWSKVDHLSERSDAGVFL